MKLTEALHQYKFAGGSFQCLNILLVLVCAVRTSSFTAFGPKLGLLRLLFGCVGVRGNEAIVMSKEV